MTPGKLPASEFCDRHRGWVDEGRTTWTAGGRVCDGCLELRSPKPIGAAPKPEPMPPTSHKRRHRKAPAPDGA